MNDRPDGTEFTLVVDGERFLVRQRPGQTDTFDYDWVSGPNPGYGFTSASSGAGGRTRQDHVVAIRSFLAAIDPATGYIADD